MNGENEGSELGERERGKVVGRNNGDRGEREGSKWGERV